MAPGRVGADQHDQVGLVEILVAARHRVGAEGPPVRRDRARHAQPRIGVDVRRADEALRELVGDVVILGQQLPREIEGDRVRPVLLGDRAQLAHDGVEGGVPRDPGAVDLRMEQPVLQRQRLAERRALGAQAAVIGRMLGVARDAGAALPVRGREHAASDPAIGAGGPHRRRRHRQGHGWVLEGRFSAAARGAPLAAFPSPRRRVARGDRKGRRRCRDRRAARRDPHVAPPLDPHASAGPRTEAGRVSTRRPDSDRPSSARRSRPPHPRGSSRRSCAATSMIARSTSLAMRLASPQT